MGENWSKETQSQLTPTKTQKIWIGIAPKKIQEWVRGLLIK